MLISGRTFIIAEAGVNHNGSVQRALDMVDAAAASGADAVKFQSFNASDLVSNRARKAEYQIENTGNSGSQLEMLRQLELTEDAHHQIAAHCKKSGIAFMSTAFDLRSLDLLSRFEMPAIKIPSGDVTAAPLILAAARLKQPMILSTGMCNLEDIESALGVIAFGLTASEETSPSIKSFEDAFASSHGQTALKSKVTLLHCVTEYPAPTGEINLRAMETMHLKFGLPVGYSDHASGTSIALAAVALGASVIEKHFTLDRTLPGPDHIASLEPNELNSLVRGIRDIEIALGSGIKLPSGSEQKNKVVARRSLIANQKIKKGDVFTQSNVAIKRPGDGIAPIHYWDIVGSHADRDYEIDEQIKL